MGGWFGVAVPAMDVAAARDRIFSDRNGRLRAAILFGGAGSSTPECINAGSIDCAGCVRAHLFRDEPSMEADSSDCRLLSSESLASVGCTHGCSACRRFAG